MGVAFTSITFMELALRFSKLKNSDLLNLLLGPSAPLPAERKDELERIVEFSTDSPPLLTDSVISPLNKSRFFLAIGYAGYSLIQLVYPFKPSFAASSYVYIPFILAIFCKASGGIAIPYLILADLQHFSHMLRVRSIAEDIGALAATIEHDIRNPVSTMEKRIEILGCQFQHDLRIQKSLGQLGEQIERIKASVDVITSLKEGPQYYLERYRSWNCVDLINTAVKETKAQSRADDVRIDVLAEHPVILVEVFRERLVQALVNILNNAIEACAERGVNSTGIIIIGNRSSCF